MTPATQDDFSAQTARQMVERFVAYFETIGAAVPPENFRRGLDTSREWLRLVNAASVSPQEVSSLLGIAQANQLRGTGWNVMATCIRSWAEKRGYPVPSFEEFYDREDWAREALDKECSSAHAADVLVHHFERRTLQDPNQKTWELALTTARTWRTLIHRNAVPPAELSALRETVRINSERTITTEWRALEQAINRWKPRRGKWWQFWM